MRSALLALVAALLLTGCADPYRTSTQPPSPRKPARSAGAPTGRPPTTQPAPVLRSFCREWANWSWSSTARQQVALARLASGPLARALAQEAQTSQRDETLSRDRLGVRGRIVALSLSSRAGRVQRGVCVTAEQNLRAGEPVEEGPRHHVYLAELAVADHGWRLTSWQPQP